MSEMSESKKSAAVKMVSSDFDGHTDFKSLTPHQKLEWLSGVVQFYFKYSKKSREQLNMD